MSEAFVKLDFECNQMCLFCCTAEDRDRLSTEGAKRLIKKYIEEMGYKKISFTGGEPTVREDLAELIKFSKSLNAVVKLQTNCMRLSEAVYAKELKEAGLDEALVSIHSYKGDVNDKITQVKGSLEKSLNGVENLLSLGVRVDIAYVITTENSDVKGFVRFIKGKYPQINNFMFFLPWPKARGWVNRRYVPRLSEIKGKLYELFEYCKTNEIYISTRGIPLCYMQGFEGYCGETQAILSKEKPMVINDYSTLEPKHSFEETNAKEPQCKYCLLNEKCGGTWREYLELHKYELWPVTR